MEACSFRRWVHDCHCGKYGPKQPGMMLVVDEGLHLTCKSEAKRTGRKREVERRGCKDGLGGEEGGLQSTYKVSK